MGVDHDAVAMIGWHLTEEQIIADMKVDPDADPSPRGTGSVMGDAVEAMAEKYGVEYGETGSAAYGGDAYYTLGFHCRDGAGASAIAVLCENAKAVKAPTEWGDPVFRCGVHIW